MRISFDLDDTLICYGGATPCERRLPWPLRLVLDDEPLRAGTCRLINKLWARGHEVWIYTSSPRRPGRLRRWFRLHGVRVGRIINANEHARQFGAGSSPSKRPHAFGIDLHVDNSRGVAMEGDAHGFAVCHVDPLAEGWVEQVLTAVDQLVIRSGASR